MRDEPIGELNPPNSVLLTPGPSCVDPRVYRAMATPIVGHLDPWFMDMMSEVQILLRRVFRTDNRVTFPLSASGSGGIEAAVLNALDEGDELIVDAVDGELLLGGARSGSAQPAPEAAVPS